MSTQCICVTNTAATFDSKRCLLLLLLLPPMHFHPSLPLPTNTTGHPGAAQHPGCRPGPGLYWRPDRAAVHPGGLPWTHAAEHPGGHQAAGKGTRLTQAVCRASRLCICSCLCMCSGTAPAVPFEAPLPVRDREGHMLCPQDPGTGHVTLSILH